jgi:hypothetical protein
MVTYKIWNDEGITLVYDAGVTCYYRQDCYTSPGAAWWHTYDIEKCVNSALPKKEVDFFLTRVSKYVPELPSTMEELFEKGVLVDCRKRSAAYSRMVGGYVRVLSERQVIFKGFTKRYKKAIDAGIDESLALLFACTHFEGEWECVPVDQYYLAHSLTHRSSLDWYDLWRTVEERDARFPKMHETVVASGFELKYGGMTQVSAFCQHPTLGLVEGLAVLSAYQTFVDRMRGGR